MREVYWPYGQGDASGNGGGGIRRFNESGMTDQDHDSGSHVFASVLAEAFDHGQSAAVADGKAFTAASGNVEFAAGSSVKNGVAGKNLAKLRSFGARGDGNRAAAQTLTDIIVGFAGEAESDAGGVKSGGNYSSVIIARTGPWISHNSRRFWRLQNRLVFRARGKPCSSRSRR